MNTKTAVKTGASRRLGLFLTESFLDNGWGVVAITRNSSEHLTRLACNQLTVYELKEYNENNIIYTIEKIKHTKKLIKTIIHNASIYEDDDDHTNDFFQYYQTLFSQP